MSSPPPLPKSKSTRGRWILAIVAVLLAPLVAVVVWILSVRSSNASAVRKLEAEVRQRGEPLTLAELKAKYPPIPDEENAAVVLLKLWESEDPVFWLAFQNGKRPLPERHHKEYNPDLPFLGASASKVARVGPLDSNSLAAAEAYLSEKSSHLEQVRAALKKPRFRFPIKIEDGPDALLPHLSILKAEAQNFLIVSLVSADRGDNAAAIKAIRETAQTGQLLAGEPILISQLVRVACLGLALNGVEQLLSRQALTAAELESVREFLGEIDLHGVAKSTLLNERPFSLCVFNPETVARVAANNSSREDGGDPAPSEQHVRTGIQLFQSIGLLDPDRRLVLETFKEAIELAGQETPESLQKIETLFNRVETNAMKFPPKLMSAMLLPALRGVPSRFAALEARRRACRVALAIEQYRRDREGRPPEKLEELVPVPLEAIPTDPFDGKQLRYHKLEKSYVLYSIGKDGEDNGGKEIGSGSRKKTDVTFFVER